MSRILSAPRLLSFVLLIVAFAVALATLPAEPQARAEVDVRAQMNAAATIVLAGMGLADGDSDEDGDVDTADWADMTTCLDGPGIPHASGCDFFDFDDDSDVDLADATAFQRVFTGEGPCPCDPDVNRDGIFSAVDIGIVASPTCFLQPPENCFEPGADVDCSGLIDQTDLDILNGCIMLPVWPPIWSCHCP